MDLLCWRNTIGANPSPFLFLPKPLRIRAPPKGPPLKIFRPRTLPILSTVNMFLLPAHLIFIISCS